MLTWIVLAHLAVADETGEGVVDRIESTRASISKTEKEQRETLSHLFSINKRIKDIAKKSARLTARQMEQEAGVRQTAQDVQSLERKSEQRQGLLNKRLRQLYQERRGNDFQWLFAAQTPVEIERNHRFLKLMIDNDHHQLKQYVVSLKELRQKRTHLKSLVAGLMQTQKEVHVQEEELAAQMREKSKILNELAQTKDSKLNELKDLRHQHAELSDVLSLAFFERRGALKAPIAGPLAREYGTFVDPAYRFRLMHKGFFYQAQRATPVHAVYEGRVVVAAQIPAYGKTVIVDHGDNYYSVYAFSSQLKVKEGAKVHEGDVVALSGSGSPLFGPGLYFEIRHFADAIDPRSWIKEPVIKTANTEREDVGAD